MGPVLCKFCHPTRAKPYHKRGVDPLQATHIFLDMLIIQQFTGNPPLSLPWHFYLFAAALIFDGTANPVHPNTIGSIDPHCQVGDVVQGKVQLNISAAQFELVSQSCCICKASEINLMKSKLCSLIKECVRFEIILIITIIITPVFLSRRLPQCQDAVRPVLLPLPWSDTAGDQR